MPATASPPELSIIIPTFNEAQNIIELGAVLHQRKLEIIVADGGSTDGTVASAQSQGFKTITSPKKGRGAQMNTGAKLAQAPVLLFLHADCRPPKNFEALILNAINGGYPAGCFRLEFDWRHPLLNFSAWLTRFDINAFRFGDQGLFITQNLWHKLGGYKAELLLLEDQDLVIRARQKERFKILPQPMLTSARKYQENGAWRLQWLFFKVWWRYQKGHSQQEIINFYRQNIKDEKQA